MPVDYLDSDAIRIKTWAIAEQFSFATIYDAAILAVAELESAQFWTADQSLLNTLTHHAQPIFKNWKHKLCPPLQTDREAITAVGRAIAYEVELLRKSCL